jgi:hypothetical protein
LALFYWFIYLHAGPRAAIAIAFTLAVSERFYHYSFDVMADLPFALGVLMFLTGYEALFHGREKKIWPWLLMAIGAFTMAIFRSVVLIFFAALVLATLWHLWRGPGRVRHLMVFLVAAVCVFVSRCIDPRLSSPFALVADEHIAGGTLSQSLGATLHHIFTVNLPELFNGAATDALFGVELGRVGNILVAIAVIGIGIAMVHRRVLWGTMVAAFVAQFVIFPFVTPRYFLPLLPILIAAAWFGIYGVGRKIPQPWGGLLATLIMLAWIAPNIANITGMIIEQQHRPYLQNYREGEFENIRQLGKLVQANTPADSWVLVEDGNWIEPVIYYTRRRVMTPNHFPEHSTETETIYYLTQGNKNLSRRVGDRSVYRLVDPIVNVARNDPFEPWLVRQIVEREPRPTPTRPATTRKSP